MYVPSTYIRSCLVVLIPALYTEKIRLEAVQPGSGDIIWGIRLLLLRFWTYTYVLVCMTHCTSKYDTPTTAIADEDHFNMTCNEQNMMGTKRDRRRSRCFLITARDREWIIPTPAFSARLIAACNLLLVLIQQILVLVSNTALALVHGTSTYAYVRVNVPV